MCKLFKFKHFLAWKSLKQVVLIICYSNKVILLKQKLKLVFNWIKTGRKATYKKLQVRTSNFRKIKKIQVFTPR